MKKRLIKLAILGLLDFSFGLAFGQTPHTATYAINASSCTTTTPCTAQVWRVVLPAKSICPAAGDVAYINVQTALVPPASNVSATNTHWDYVDTGSTLVSGGTYCGYATVTFTSGGGPSKASAIFQATIPTPPIVPPTAPDISVILK